MYSVNIFKSEIYPFHVILLILLKVLEISVIILRRPQLFIMLEFEIVWLIELPK